MKNLTLILLFLFVYVAVFCQVRISFDNNALVPGDSIITREITAIDPGGSGPAQVWDFSKIQFTGNNPVSHLYSHPDGKISNASISDLQLNEMGYDYYFSISQTQLVEVGLITGGISLVYTDPLIKMKYPFVYGQNYTDQFAGVCTYPDNRTADVSGEYTLTADAFGTLILPDRILHNTLRLKVEKDGILLTECGPTQSKSTRYMWYAPGVHYPVLSTITSEIRAIGMEPRITKKAFENQKEIKPVSSTPGLIITDSYNNVEVSAVVYPSPFRKTLTYQYYLPVQMPVSADLYTMDGKMNISLVKNLIQSPGLHAGELDADDYVLMPGVYFLRFTFGKKVIVSKVVRMQ